MTPDERATLHNFGVIVTDNLATIVPSIFLQGVFNGIFGIYLIHVLQRGFSARATKILFAASLTAFLVNILNVASNLAINAIELKGILVNPVGGAIDETLLNLVDSELVALEILAGWAIQILLVIIDCVVVWRAWVLYFDRRWIMIVPLFLLTATTGLSLATVILTSDPSLALTTHALIDGFTIVSLLSNISVFTSFATNVISTFLILVKLWMHRRSIGRSGHRRKFSGPSRALLVLVESGIFYIALETLSIISDYVVFPGSFVFNKIAVVILYGSAGMYPIVVILMIQTKRSEIETFGFSTIQRLEAADVEGLPKDGQDAPSSELVD